MAQEKVVAAGAEQRTSSSEAAAQGTFAVRHIGPSPAETVQMLKAVGSSTLEDLTGSTVPPEIRLASPLRLPPPLTEDQALAELRKIAQQNRIYRSFIGLGFADCITPPVIQRMVLENPGWYTQYTPYQAEIAQGRLEALLNFQTMVSELTGMEIANASLLDEATAAAEAMLMCYRLCAAPEKRTILAAADLHPTTIAVLRTRAAALGLEIAIEDPSSLSPDDGCFAVIVQYPGTDGAVRDYSAVVERAHAAGALVIVAVDLLALALLTPPGHWGADVVVGNTQRFGVPLGFGGPHAAFLAAKENARRELPGRLVGVSRDASGKPALRLALQTREQHIRREKATSNICTAQVLLAVIAAMYGVYHGPQGIKRIAERIHRCACALRRGLSQIGIACRHETFFDTLRTEPLGRLGEQVAERAVKLRINLRFYDDGSAGIALDEKTAAEDLQQILRVFGADSSIAASVDGLLAHAEPVLSDKTRRAGLFMQQPVFNSYHSETEMLRYLSRLQSKDLSLTTSMIPLGSCTMKLNAAAEMLPITWPEFAAIHPFAPREQTSGYQLLVSQLEEMLAEITGMAGVSLQPNAGSQGEYAGLLVVRAYHASRGAANRDVCLIPQSAHGTNPASAAMAGLTVAVVRCDDNGNVDLADLRSKAGQYKDRLACLMVTYPSTHGVFEEGIREICGIIHDCGGLVYMDGANLNAQVGLCRPGDFGVDVCHLNLHKTFAIPHGGGGPGMGPIAVAAHLADFLPGHPLAAVGGSRAIGPVSAAPWGSAGILPISWCYIRMMGAAGLRLASQTAILNANYIAVRLDPYFPVLYRGRSGTVAHECILDVRRYKRALGIEAADIAKRLMDYGFHAPTVSFPVAETLMVEPTESESKAELDRFCEAMISIYREIEEIEQGAADRTNNVLKNAPHTAELLALDDWPFPYSRLKAAYPAQWLKEHKFWPSVRRVDNTFGDRNLTCCST